jgi:FKBP-type peptidyl-prolyl cis-trans isomerase
MVFVSYIHRLCVLSLVVYRCSAVSELSVNVYEGPKECDEAKKVKKGDFLDMHYTGTIDESSKAGEKGQKFDSSLDRGKTLGFTVGVGQVIKGWDQGLVGLCKGAKV